MPIFGKDLSMVNFSSAPHPRPPQDVDIKLWCFREIAKYIFTVLPSKNIINSILYLKIIASLEYPQITHDYSSGTHL